VDTKVVVPSNMNYLQLQDAQMPLRQQRQLPDAQVRQQFVRAAAQKNLKKPNLSSATGTSLLWYQVFRMVTNGAQFAWAARNFREFVTEQRVLQNSTVSEKLPKDARNFQAAGAGRPAGSGEIKEVGCSDSSRVEEVLQGRTTHTVRPEEGSNAGGKAALPRNHDSGTERCSINSDAVKEGKEGGNTWTSWRTSSADCFIIYVIVLFIVDLPITRYLAPRRLSTAFIIHHVFGLISSLGFYSTKKCYAHYNLAMCTEIYPLLLYTAGVIESLLKLRENQTEIQLRSCEVGRLGGGSLGGTDIRNEDLGILTTETTLLKHAPRSKNLARIIQGSLQKIINVLNTAGMLSIPIFRLPVWFFLTFRAFRGCSKANAFCRGGSMLPILLDLFWFRGHVQQLMRGRRK
jgi:hypothetical protein